MYIHHPHFFDVPNETKIWKYLDLFKYLDLISANKLFLLRVDCYNDKFEGKGHDSKKLSEIFEQNDLKAPNNILGGLEQVNKSIRESSYVNCWHINEHESSVMWDAYSNPNGGIVIESTVGQLKSCIKDERDIYISRVIYDRDNMSINNALLPLIHKRPEFKEEKELRIFFTHEDALKPITEGGEKESLPKFQKIDINVSELITNSYFHPLTEDWVVESLKGVIAPFGFTPKKSKLYS